MTANLPQNQPQSQQGDDKIPPPKAGVNNQSTADLTSAQPKTVPATPVKEDKESIGGLYKEAEPRLAEKTEFEPAAEVKEWVTEVQEAEEINLPQPIKDDFGQILMESAMPSKPKIVLPLTQPKTQQALHQKLIESIRWLAVWCLRLIKMWPKRAKYKEVT